MTIHHTKINKLVNQALEEIKFAQDYKDARMKDWDRNEQMLLANDLIDDKTTRSKLTLGKMRGFVDTMLSKIDNTIDFKYKAPEPADYTRAELLNALKDQDKEQGCWKFLDILGKEDGIIYGRTTFFYKSDKDSEGNYISNLSLIDPKDFLIDPEAGGFDKEKAGYLGWWGTKITRTQLEKGLKKGIYLKTNTKRLLSGSGNNDERTPEEEDKEVRIEYLGNTRQERILQKDFIFKFYTWITTDEEDERYYLILTPSGQCVRCEKWKDIRKSGRYPIWTYALYPNEREFWTPSPCDFVRKVFLSQEKSIRQLMDNSEQINKPQMVINPDKISNLSDIKYKPENRIILLNQDVKDTREAMNTFPSPSISNPMSVYETLERIVGIESGITQDIKGVSEEETLGIYEGNVEQASDRIELKNNNISYGYREFGILYKEGIEQDLTKEKAVEIIGNNGLEVRKITRADIKATGKDYNIIIESSLSEARSDFRDRRNKMTFINAYRGAEFVNQKSLFEKGGKMVNFEEEDIKEMLNTNDFSTMRILSEADRIFQDLRKGKKFEIFREADTGFLQRLNDLLTRYTNELDNKQYDRVINYIGTIMPIVDENMARMMFKEVPQEAMRVGAGKVEIEQPVEEINQRSVK